MRDVAVRTDIHDQIAVLTLNRPESRNALSVIMLTQLDNALARLRSNHRVRVVVLAAAGSVFSSGHALGEMIGKEQMDYEMIFRRCTAVMEAITDLPQPVIARVQGPATAAGCQLAASCDLVVAAETATFATPGVKIGLFCSTPAVAVSRALPTKKALEMLLTGTPMSARDAERFGLVNRVVPVEQLDKAVEELSAPILAASFYTVALGKRAFYSQLPMSRHHAYIRAGQAMVKNARMSDAQEGMRAFLQKRPPVWGSTNVSS